MTVAVMVGVMRVMRAAIRGLMLNCDADQPQGRLLKRGRGLLWWVVPNIVEQSPLVGACKKPPMLLRCLLRVYAYRRRHE
jgi:hypothetical protein